MADPVAAEQALGLSFVFGDVLNPGYVLVNVGVDADIPSHEVSNLDPLELVSADDSSDSHFLPEVVQREGERERWSDLLTGRLQPLAGTGPAQGSALAHEHSTELGDRKLESFVQLYPN